MRRFVLVALFALLPMKAYCTNGIGLTLLLVPEQDACVGGSYLDGSCQPVTFDQAQQWLDDDLPHQSFILQPGSHAVKLTTAFFKKLVLLVDYETFPPPGTNGRRVVILLFKIHNAPGGIAILKRLPSNGIDAIVARMPVGQAGHALTHQRADAFKPFRSVRWQLDVGPNEYVFWMKKP